MSETQWRKLDALEHVVSGDWTMAMGAQAAGVSVRQLRRLRRPYECATDKPRVVIHGNMGRRPSNRVKDELIEKVLGLREKLYAGFNDTHFTEKLVEIDKLKISRRSVQRILRAKQITHLDAVG